ncbi:uncharacterized protein LOC111703643 isoform X2 [Eurytemora carolleeae]|nr:uncharacterized protein LOC111703643 isoform X2 [Eurytemora carolleeae]|eukprot:XP_023331422.1 uncharacterized protein LOC111703643 isoform X2 [Eurytemora affinis]
MEHNHILEQFTETRFNEDLKSCEEFKGRAEKLLSSTADPEQNLNLRFLIAELDTFISGFPFTGFYYPMNYMEGVQVDFEKLLEWSPPESVKDYENIIARYSKFSTLADQIVGMMRKGIEMKRTNHAVSMQGVEEQCRSHLGEPRETVFYKPFQTLNFTDQENKRLQAEALSAIESSVQAGFLTLANFVSTEYASATRPEIGASSISAEYYKACLAFHTSTNLTAEEIHQKGLDEVGKIEEEMREVIKEMGLNLTLPQFMEKLRTDKSNFFNSPQELLDTFKDIIENKIDKHILLLFHSKPKTKMEIRETPASTPDAPAAYYIAGTVDGSRPGRLYVNTHKYQSQPRYEMISLSLHESNPGHHLQGSYTLERAGWPEFRKSMEDRVYSQTPTRFPINTAYVEGWGLYCETLGFDMGLYSNPLDRYGHLSEEIFRACRLVVDTGMHALGWSQEKAVEYMLTHSAATLDNIKGEVNRYVTWPGQATGYKIGQMKIRELRALAETQLGDKFNIKDFHEAVLQAAGPLFILEQQVEQYINNNK